LDPVWFEAMPRYHPDGETEAVRISPDHPLRRLFKQLVSKELPTDREVAAYVANLFIDFTRVDHLYRIRNSRGKRLEEVGEMLVESNPLLDAASFEREREVRKHIGDYTLFLTGMFPEDAAHGGAGAPLFRRLAAHFEYCVHRLNRAKTLRRRSMWRRNLRA
jgi:hypothetical protein